MPQTTGRFRFGPYELDSVSGELTKNGRRIRLQMQPTKVLLALATRAGEVVTREELRAHIWGDETFVDFDQGLNKAVNKLREVLNDSAATPRYIETLPRRGYRFIGTVVDETPIPAVRTEASANGGLATAEALSGSARPPRSRLPVPLIIATAGLLLLGVAYQFWKESRTELRIVESRQLSRDGRRKSGAILTDGRRVYFVEPSNRGGDDLVISWVPTTGGATTQLPMPLMDKATTLEDLSPDGTRLLLGVRVHDGRAGRRLWVMSTGSGEGHPIGNIRAWGANFSPGGDRVIYGQEEGLYTADLQGTDVRKFVDAEAPVNQRWRPDRSLIRISRFNPKKSGREWWDMKPDGSFARRVPGPATEESSAAWTRDGRYFLFLLDHRVHSIREPSGWFGRHIHRQVTSEGIYDHGLALDPEKTVMYTVAVQQRGEVVRYDREKRVWLPYLSSLSAQYVDFSRDGQWVVYVQYPEGEIWRSRVDGTERVQLTSSERHPLPHMPRWSPDGSRIAFSAWKAGTGPVLFTVPSGGGPVTELLRGKGTNSDPGWASDGRQLVYAPFPWRLDNVADARVSVLDLETNRVTQLPGSVPAWSPRWSPDGRYIVALGAPGNAVMLHTVADGTWRRLYSKGTCPVWSRDSRHVYVAVDKLVKRIRLDGSEETVADFKGVDRAVTGLLHSWEFGVAPDESVIAMRNAGSEEIYALTYVEE